MKPCLVLNKLDRLFMELKLTPLEAFQQLKKVLEQVNAIVGTFYAAEMVLEHQLSSSAVMEEVNEASSTDENIYFAPEKGNVLFASAIDGWAFRSDADTSLDFISDDGS